MKEAPKTPKKRHPWRNALIATTWLSIMFLLATLLWQSGYAQWAFLVGFLAVWLLLSVSWSNIHFTEESGSILAKIVDHNFNQMHNRLEQLEQDLAHFRDHVGINHDASGNNSTEPTFTGN